MEPGKDGLLISTNLSIRPWNPFVDGPTVPVPHEDIVALCCGPPLAFMCNQLNIVVWAVLFDEDKHLDALVNFTSGRIKREEALAGLAQGYFIKPTVPDSQEPVESTNPENLPPQTSATLPQMSLPATFQGYPRFSSPFRQPAPPLSPFLTPMFPPFRPASPRFLQQTQKNLQQSFAARREADNILAEARIKAATQMPASSSWIPPPETTNAPTRRRKSDVLPAFIAKNGVDDLLNEVGAEIRRSKTEEEYERGQAAIKKLERMPPIHHLNQVQLRHGYYRSFLGQYGAKQTAAGTQLSQFMQRLSKSVKGQTKMVYRDTRLPADPDAKGAFGPRRANPLVKNGVKRKWLKIDAYYPVLELDTFNNLNLTKLFVWVIYFKLFLILIFL